MANRDFRSEDFDLSIKNEVDEICDQFEILWKSGTQPNISEYLQRSAAAIWPMLLVELVRVDLDYRTAAGQSPTSEYYAQRFPQFQDCLEKLTEFAIAEQQQLLHQIGNFRLIERVGSGTFGVVWKAWDCKLEREVAVKLPTERSLGREYAAEFRHEAKAAAKLNHPGIVRVMDYGVHDGITYIVSEFIDGLTLREWIKKNHITPQVAAELCAQIADALQHAHENGVIHRDLKPGNILIDKDSRSRIADFGLAKRLGTESTIAGSGAIVGTYAYMSPEQAIAASRNVDGRSDIYSLGVILGELVEGNVTHWTSTLGLGQKSLNDPSQFPMAARLVPAELKTICCKCLQKRPEDRFQTAAELAAVLREFLSNGPKLSRPIPRYIILCKAVLRRPWLMAMAASLLAASSFVLWRSSESNTENEATGISAPITDSRHEGQGQPVTVHIQTEPKGAIVSFAPCDPKHGEPDFSQASITPVSSFIPINLMPGQYLVSASFLDSNGFRTNTVIRTVPGPGFFSNQANWEHSRPIAANTVEWPVIKIPPIDVTNGMVYVNGTHKFVVKGPEGPRTFVVEPFYVSAREFSFGDFQRIRPGSDGWIKDRPATKEPPAAPMPSRYDMAVQWAEESGGRLLTDLEFAYLSYLVENSTDSQVEEILSGLAEWTSTWPTSPVLATSTRPTLFANAELSQYRVVRGGWLQSRPDVAQCSADTFEIAAIYDYFPNVGFRVARSPSPNPNEEQ